jgi:hypothetical protein
VRSTMDCAIVDCAAAMQLRVVNQKAMCFILCNQIYRVKYRATLTNPERPGLMDEYGFLV